MKIYIISEIHSKMSQQYRSYENYNRTRLWLLYFIRLKKYNSCLLKTWGLSGFPAFRNGYTSHLATQHILLCGMVLVQDPILCHHSD